jgi:hypothetical protein
LAEERPAVVFLSHPQGRDSGDYRHRVTLPGQALTAHLRVIDIQTSHPDSVAVALKADLLVHAAGAALAADVAILVRGACASGRDLLRR